jgi:DNA helicase-2/ATP-dependent DNA helicase PcrA
MTPALNTKANERQLEAIQTTEGPLLIIAGPGSGKTFTLVERALNILTKGLAEPENLLIATFTDKAARELKTRLSNRLLELNLKHNINEMYIGTFHSICIQILEKHREFTRLRRNFVMLDQFDQQYLIYQKISRFQAISNMELVGGNKTSGRWKQSSGLMEWVNKLSEEAANIPKLKSASDAAIVAAALCYEEYQRLLDETNSIDFSTIQSETLKILHAHPNVALELQRSIKYIMVDEFQDTNTIQSLLLSKLTNAQQNICVVGDDDQGLYRFRGATIRNILEFPTQFPAGRCKQIKLETNYRSHPEIINFYNKWMSDQDWETEGKSFRFSKSIVPDNREHPSGPAAIRVPAPSASKWEEVIESFLRSLQEKKILSDWNQVAFLFRSVKSDGATALAQHLESNGIPVYSPRSNLFFDRPEVRLLFGALLFMFPQYKDLRQWEDGVQFDIWTYYDEMCLRPFAQLLRKPENVTLLQFCQERAQEHRALSDTTDYTFLGLIYRILKFPIFAQLLEANGGGLSDERPARNISILTKLLGKFEYLHNISVLTPKFLPKHLTDLFNNYMRFLMAGGISEYEDDSEYAPSGCVSFLTIHQSKGLEFPVVIVDSLNSEPRKQYTDLDELFDTQYSGRAPYEPLELTKHFDFKRLYYTAFSRAQNLLVLSCQEVDQARRKKVPTKYFKDHYLSLPDWSNINLSHDSLRLEKVKEMTLKTEYSFTSHINLFETCAQQYKFFKYLGFNPVREGSIVFGTLIHETIEDIHKKVLRGEEEMINKEMIRSWFFKNYENLSKSQRVYLANIVLEAGLRQVISYFDRERVNFGRLKEAEVEVSLVKDGYILNGKIDLIRGAGDTVEIIDFKSEAKPDMEVEAERINQYRRQLEIYAHIVEGRHGHRVSKMHLYYTGEESGSPWVTFERSEANISNTIKQIDKVVERIESRDFVINERPLGKCKNCDMKPYCDDNFKKAA